MDRSIFNFWRHENDSVTDAELARFGFYLHSDDPEVDDAATFFIEGMANARSDTRFYGDDLKTRLQRIVSEHLPPEVRVVGLNVQRGASISGAFLLVWAGTVSLYVLISRYDNFRKSFDRIREEIRSFLQKLGPEREPVETVVNWHEGFLFRDPPIEPQIVKSCECRICMWYLCVTNILLLSMFGWLVYVVLLARS